MMKKIFIISVSSLILLLIICIIINYTKPKNNNIISIRTSYSSLPNEIIKVPIYFAGANDFEKEVINQVFLLDDNEKTKILVDIYDAYKYGKVVFNDIKYSVYVYELVLPKIPVSIEELYMKIETDTNTLKIKIGSLKIQDIYQDGNHLDISKLYSIVGNKPETILGIVMSIKNKTNEKISIKKVMIDGINVFCDNKNIRIIDQNVEYKSNEKMTTIIPNYNSICLDSIEEETNIEIGDEIKIVIPIRYKKISFMDTCPIVITYEINGFTYTFIQKNYRFFNNSYKLTNQGSVIIDVNN